MRTLIFDTETTNLVGPITMPLDRQPKIIEFFGIILEDGKEIDSYGALINPKLKITEEITKITSITNEDLKNCKEFEFHAGRIKEMIESVDEVVAHNMTFDKQMIDMDFKRIDQQVKWPFMLCTVEATMHLKGYRLNLSSLYEFLFKEKFQDAHRAEADVRALTRCFIELGNRGIV